MAKKIKVKSHNRRSGKVRTYKRKKRKKSNVIKKGPKVISEIQYYVDGNGQLVSKRTYRKLSTKRVKL